MALHFLRGKIAAGIVLAGEVAGILLRLGLVTEAVVGVAAFHEALGVGEIGVAPLGLHIRADWAADIGAFIVVKTAVAQRFINDLDRAFHLAGLIGVLDAEQELAVRVAGDAPGVERRAQIAYVHIPRGARREARAYLTAGDALLHFLKPCIVHCKSLLKLFRIPSNPSVKNCVFITSPGEGRRASYRKTILAPLVRGAGSRKAD